MITDIRKIIPHKKSIQLAKSFNNPNDDLTNKTTPKIIKTWLERFMLAPNIKIKPAIMSNAPKILTNMFFKSKYPLKICACSSVWIRALPS